MDNVLNENNNNIESNDDIITTTAVEDNENINNEEDKIKTNKKNQWQELLPSSSNWYCTTVSDCNEDQIYIYACKSNVSIFNVNSKKFLGELNGHTDRVTSVGFFKKFDKGKQDESYNWCITGSDDKTVRIWNITFDPIDGNNSSCIQGGDSNNCRTTTNNCIYYHQEHKTGITCVLASPLVSDLILSGDKEGSLVIYRTLTNHVFPIPPIIGTNISITTLSFSPNNSELIAIGYLNGIVLIYNFVIRSIVCKISAHSSEVGSIIWFDSNIIKQNNIFSTPLDNESNSDSSVSTSTQEPVYLATSSKDKTIKLWKQVGDKIENGFTNIYQLNPSKYSIQHNSSNSGGAGNQNDKQRIWLTLSWSPITPQYLLSNSLTSDILLWDLNNYKSAPDKFQSGHQRLIFSITQIPPNSNKLNKKKQQQTELPPSTTSISTKNSNSNNIISKYKNKLITTSLDRQLIIWENCKVKNKIQAMGGFIYSIDTCVFTPNTFAIGCGDNTIRLWSPTENVKNVYETKTLWKGIQSKVTSLSICKDYGFANSHLIAFGMDDGRIGIFNVNTNQSKIFPGGHKNEIYEIIWRPSKSSSSSPNKLYSIGNNEIFEWDYNEMDKGFKNMTTIIQSLNPTITFSKHKTDIDFNLDGDLIAIGHSDGTIDIFSKEFHFLTRIREHKKLINRVKWNPHQENKSILASASTDKKVIIYNLSKTTVDNNKEEGVEGVVQKETTTDNYKIETLYQFTNHKSNVCSVNWSASDINLLASASADGTVQVWNIESKEPISNMRGHDGRVFSVCWSLINSNLLVSGGEDQTVRLWNYTEQPFKTSNDSQIQKSSSSQPQLAISLNKKVIEQQQQQKKQQQQQQQQQSLESKESQESQETTVQPIATSTSTTTSATIPVVTENNNNTILPKKRPILILNKDIVQKLDNIQYIIPLAKYCTTKDTNEDNVVYDYGGSGTSSGSVDENNNKVEAIFSNNQIVINKLIEKESIELLKIDDVENYVSLNCWNGNLKSALCQVVKHGKLTGNIVALSVQAGREIYEQIVNLYSQQLICIGDYHLAASYLLMIGRVNEAIQVYRNTLCYQEAILLAKSRYPINHPIIDQLFIEWGKQTETSHPAHTIKCYLATIENQLLNSKLDLVKLLNQNNSKQILKVKPDLEPFLK